MEFFFVSGDVRLLGNPPKTKVPRSGISDYGQPQLRGLPSNFRIRLCGQQVSH